MKRPLQVFVAVLCIAALGAFVVPVPRLFYWTGAVVVGAILAGLAAAGDKGSPWGTTGGSFLCDRCKYNHPRYCSRPERPNATRCPDFKSRGG